MVQMVPDGYNGNVLEVMGFNLTQWQSLTKTIKMAETDWSTFNYNMRDVLHK